FAIDNVGDINCVEEDPDGGLWLGTNGDGLVYWNRNTGVRRSFTRASSSIPSDVVVCMLRDRRGRLWMGTFWGGLTCCSGGRFTNYNYVRTEDGNVPLENVWSLAEDGQGNLWLGTLGGGLICFNPDKDSFACYNKANSGIASDYVMSLCFDHSGTLVIGTSMGVSFLNPVTKTVGVSPPNGAGEGLSEVKYVVQVYEDSRNMLWFATRNGLYAYSSGTLYNVPVESDLSKFIFLGIAEDINKNIWVSTGGDLINIVPVMDIKGGKPYFNCYSYNEWDGLQLCNFNQRSLRSLKSGEVVAGGLYGLTRFRPDRIKYNRVLPKVMFSGFRLFDEDVEVGQSYDGNVILRKTLNEADSEVRLEYRQNVFTVRFASDDYVMPDKTRYFYKLDGFSDGWLATGAGLPRVTYTNLSPGTYCLRVRATNGDGYAGSEEAELRIVIMPPWWRTTAAYISYALLFALLLFLAFLFIRRREQHRFRLRQMEQDAIKTEELNQLKFKFFTNVSHELRTPLTLIISPLESLLAETTDVGLREKLGRMQRNAVRLLNLVNQLLDFRKNSETDVHLNLFEGDIVMFVRNICNSFLTLSERQDMHLTFFSAMESLDMQFDEDKFGKIVTNLLSNAFKFTPSGGRVDVSLDCPSHDLFELKVSDTGVGISDEDKEHIFDRFYRVENEDNHTTGSGIGLSLVHDFVTLHNGSVRVLDNAGGGSVFVVTIPIRHSASYVAAKPEAAADEGQEAVVGQDRPVALFVDDNADLVSFMKDSLGLYFRVQTASNGREAWEMIRRSAPDVVVCDVMMPEMDGNELCRLVKSDQLTAHIPFILLTAKQSLENKLEGLTLGADDYVTKPFNVEVLILRMRKLIELSGGRRSRSRIEPEPEPIVITSMDEKLVEKAIRKVEENISNPDFSVEALSRELGMSRVQLYKKLLRITGKTPVEFIRVIRLKRAVQFLRESQLNVSEVAYRVGFNNPRYFTKYFKEEFGVLPSAFQYKETKK
ncbi:MAG: response regulator, partial [Bacteroidales bacterium]|nr:response regulator [Bacteroidales bacterium]